MDMLMWIGLTFFLIGIMTVFITVFVSRDNQTILWVDDVD